MIFISWSSNGSSGAFVPPLLVLLPFVLQGGFGIFNFIFAGLQREPSGVGTVAQSREDEQQSLVQGGWDLFLFIFAVAVGIVTFIFVKQNIRAGWWTNVRRSLEEGLGWRSRPQAQSRLRSQHSRRHVQRSHSARFAEMTNLIQKMPVEDFVSAEQLRGLPAYQLKVHLQKQGIAMRAGESMDKEDIVSRLMALRDSSGCTCSVCCEDYQDGDSLRVLSCRHKFHVECIDRWLLSSTDRSERPCCPMCNANLQ